ncbi:MAG: hypothetical protein NZ839_02760 [Endomicrobia bacterium]|nr:hypothetical protein [Endomicrobiia bacterium]MCX7716220.1 hypothetical protein [Endomicrobiia bacterium]
MKKYSKDIQLSQLVDASQPYAILEEVKNNFIQHYPVGEFFMFRMVFHDFIDLMEGRYPGYQKCNTKFHDIQHTTEALLAISRLIDGYNIKNKNKLPLKKVKLALIATLFHDSGYIQTINDTEGSGAKYTLTHVERSIEFLNKYLSKKGFTKEDVTSACNMVRCTGMRKDVPQIKFSTKDEKTLGLMLGTADYLGQMSSRTYLEKLVFLYYEFKEGGVPGYSSEFDLLKKTLQFYQTVKTELDTVYEKIYVYALYHFKRRYGINKNLYFTAIERAINYLKTISSPQEMPLKLRRMI